MVMKVNLLIQHKEVVDEMEEVKRMVIAAINTIKHFLGVERKKKRDEMKESPREKKMRLLEKALEEKDVAAIKRLGVKGTRKRRLMKGERKLMKWRVQDEIEKEMEEKIRDRRRIAVNARFFRFGVKMGRKEMKNENSPDPEETLNLWRKLYEKEDEESEEMTMEEEETEITIEDVERAAKSAANWKCPGPDFIQGFWWKHLSGVWGSLKRVFQGWLREPENNKQEETKGRTFLLFKKGDERDPANIHTSPA